MCRVNVNFENAQTLILKVKTQNRWLSVLSVRKFLCFGFICFSLENLDNIFNEN